MRSLLSDQPWKRRAVLAAVALGCAACGGAGAVVASNLDAGGSGPRAQGPAPALGGTSDEHPPHAAGSAAAALRATQSSLASATKTTTTTLPVAAPGLVAGRVTVVGDSVTIDAQPALQADIPNCVVDAQVGEQWSTGVGILQQLRADGQLGSLVVVALGTNGPVSSAQFAQLMSVVAGTSRVVVVTNHGPPGDSWMEQNNALFRSELPHYTTLRLADWDGAAAANPSWLYSDDTHMPIGGPGAQAFAELVKADL